MSFYKAKEMFDDALHYVDAHKSPAEHDLHAGLFQLSEALEYEISKLHQEIEQLSQKIRRFQR